MSETDPVSEQFRTIAGIQDLPMHVDDIDGDTDLTIQGYEPEDEDDEKDDEKPEPKKAAAKKTGK